MTPSPPHNGDPQAIVDWLETIPFPYSEDERDVMRAVKARRYTGEPTSVFELYEIRILYWQVIGSIRARNIVYSG